MTERTEAQVVETLREHCERHAREWDETAEFAITALAAADGRQASRIRALCLQHAEDWRARARRCAR